MPIGNIDYDRGVIINTHQLSGMDVFMYVDDPGVYLTAHGRPVAENLAQQAGYDIEKLAKDRVKKARKMQAMSIIDNELSDESDVREDIVEERNGFQLLTTGGGRHHVVDPDGNRLTMTPLPLESAQQLFNGMAGPAVAKVEEKKAK